MTVPSDAGRGSSSTTSRGIGTKRRCCANAGTAVVARSRKMQMTVTDQDGSGGHTAVRAEDEETRDMSVRRFTTDLHRVTGR
jgi:hypothetical protein